MILSPTTEWRSRWKCSTPKPSLEAVEGTKPRPSTFDGSAADAVVGSKFHFDGFYLVKQASRSDFCLKRDNLPPSTFVQKYK